MHLKSLVSQRSVIVTCGAGGVGKTTTSAAMALAAARMGRRALVLTIDPARRLAQALGIPPTGPDPVQISPEQLQQAGVQLPEGGELHAWMLDPKVVLERVVDRFAPTPEDAKTIRGTRLYQALCEVISGLQEYTAAEALHTFFEEKRYDLIVLDTPPSRNALDFLDAPRRLSRFLDERTLGIFAPQTAGRLNPMMKAAAKVVNTALAKTFGEDFAQELRTFLGAFGKLFSKMRVHASGVRTLLMSDAASFVVVASPDAAAREEALYFRNRIHDLGLVAEGFILNRSFASDQMFLDPKQVGEGAQEPVLKTALKKLEPLADRERVRIEQDQQLLAELEVQGKQLGGQGATAFPFLDEAVEDLPALHLLSSVIVEDEA